MSDREELDRAIVNISSLHKSQMNQSSHLTATLQLDLTLPE